mmetsp:Transcript_35851/g.54979  ORF Transcript_35851/g.54979 Transcript_35851/m.54979 type:complete len:102 (+) Transcript_35851:1523-1828(+)
MVSIPVLPEMLEAVEQDKRIAEQYDVQTIENFISGLFVSFQSMGEAIGPICSSYLTQMFGFTVSQEIYCFILFLFWGTYFLFCGNFKMFGAASAPEHPYDA